MGNSIFDNNDIDSPFGDWLQENTIVTSVTPHVNFLTKNRTFKTGKTYQLTFKLYGATGYINDTWYEVALTSSNSNLKISTNGWGGENGYKFLTKVSLTEEGTVTLYLSIDGKVSNSYTINFVKPKSVSRASSKKLIAPKGITCKPLSLTDKQKAQFKAVVLSETSHGFKSLWDVSWIYFSRISDMGFEKGMKGSTPYIQKSRNYQLWMYYLGQGDEYKDNYYEGTEKIKDYVIKNGWFTGRILTRGKPCIKYIDDFVLIDKPINKYKGWHGQGYWGDINLNPDQGKGDQWYMARQYYLLQKEGKVTNEYIVLLEELNGDGRIKDQSTFIFDVNKIVKYFKDNPAKLPKPDDVKQYNYNDGKKFKR